MGALLSDLAAVAKGSGARSLDDVMKLVDRELGAGALSRSELVDAINATAAGEKKARPKRIASAWSSLKKEAGIEGKLTARIDALTKQIESGDFPAKTPKPGRAMSEAVADLKRIEARLKGKADLLAKTKQIRAEIESGQFAPTGPKKGPRFAGDAEMERLQFNYEMAKAKHREVLDSFKPQGMKEKLIDIASAPRSILASMDFSAVGRQGGMLAMANPGKAMKAMGQMFRATASPKAALKQDIAIMNRPNAPLYKKAKLYLAPSDAYGPLSAREEAFKSKIVERLPLVGGLIRASDRAYTSFLNRIRADVFDTMVEGLAKNGQPTAQEIEAIANYVNVATGRGKLGSLENAADGLAQIFFSPRYVASRFQIVAGQPLYGGTAQTRKLIAKEYAKAAIGMGVALGTATLFGGGMIGTDPNDTDFLRRVVDKTRTDFTAGLAPAYVTAHRTAKQVYRQATGTGTQEDTRKYFGQMKSFGRSKLAPLPSAGLSVMMGKDFKGDEATVASEAGRMVLPITVQNFWEAADELGLERSIANGLWDMFGFSTNTRLDKKPKPAPSRQPFTVGQR